MPPDFRCGCGARREAIELWALGESGPERIPGPLAEPCTCPPPPRCIACHSKLTHPTDAPHPSCDNLDCPLWGVWQLEPATKEDA